MKIGKKIQRQVKAVEVLDRFERAEQERRAHQLKLETEHDLGKHPKKDLLYQLAWDYGHSCGFHEVELYYSTLAELLK